MNILYPIDNACIKLIMVRCVLELIVRHTLHFYILMLMLSINVHSISYMSSLIMHYLIESHFVGVHMSYELPREK